MPATSPRNTLLGCILWPALTLLAAASGGLASSNSKDFYAALTRPAWAPPGWLFGPVWTALYVLMAIAAVLVWLTPDRRSRPALVLFTVQLVLNGLWTWLFFTWRLGAIAFAEILLLWALIAWTIISFARVRRVAAVMLLPYLAWVSFASFLSLTIWRLNPTILGTFPLP
ncbi:MAG: tryptophan-rich sensory protein [Leptolyngbya sp. PLA1]|nr:tryptophan-rich sensory protein [Leptolyngbya sp. PLA1]